MNNPTGHRLPSAANAAFTRRSLLRTAGFGLGAVALSPYLTGCDTGSGDQNQSSSATQRVSVGQEILSTTFDPALTVTAVAVNKHIYQSLYRHSPFPPQTDLTPDLALDLPQKIDDTTYRVKIHDKVTFHDGQPLTAEDIAFTFAHYMKPTEPSFLTRFFDPLFTSIKAVNSTEIEIRLKAPTTLLADRLAVLQIASKKAVQESPKVFETQPVGSGPYRAIDVTPGEALTLERFPDYTGAGNYNIEEAAFTKIQDPSARLAGLFSSQFDIITLPPEGAFQQISDNGDLNIEAVPGNFSTFLFFNNSRAPFNDVRVRQAVLYAIDRDTINETSFFGFAEPAWSGVIRPDDPDYAEPSTTYSYDPERAKKLMSQAGYGSSPIPIKLHGTNLEPITTQLPVIQENLRAIGIEAEIRPGDTRSPADVGADAFVLVSSPDIFAPDAEFILRWLYYGLLPREFAFLDDATASRIEQKLDQAYRAPDEATRREFLAQAQNLIQELVPLAPLHRKKNLTAWNNRVSGFRPPALIGVFLNE